MRANRRLPWAATGLVLLVGFSLTSRVWAAKHEHDRDDDDDHGRHYYSEQDRDYMRNWYHHHDDQLPPGLSQRDQLPPGLEKQLRVRGTLPPGLRKKMMPCPEEMEHRLPPPPPGCAHVVIGGHVALVNRSTYMVLDIFHFEQ